MGSADAPVEIDGFTELRLIGSGSASQVYSGYQPLLDRRVALKVFTNSTIDDATRSRFERESALLGALGEVRGVVTVYATTFTRDGRPVIVMRLIGQSLGELLAEHGARPVEEVFRGALDLGAGLSHAHGSGVVHRDIKPENVLVDEEGHYWLADFGIAAVGVADLSVQTQGAMTPAHAPPERFTSSQPERDVADWMAGDLWSLGSTLYTALCGRPPFGSPSDPGGMAAMMQRLIRDEVVWPGPPAPKGSPLQALQFNVEELLEKEPFHRPESAQLFVTRLLHEAQSGVDGGGDGRGGVSDQRFLAAALILVVLVVVLLTVLAVR